MEQKKINIGIVGLGFGKEFINIYKLHPNVGKIAICARTKSKVEAAAAEHGIPEELCYTSIEDMLKNDDLDAIHLATDIPDHYKHTMMCLKAGKHTACAVPMGMTIQECADIVNESQKQNRIYMMLETHLFTREFLYVKKLVDEGKFGKLQFLRSDHMQNMTLPGWPDYWLGYPPFLYGTHALAPAFEIIGKQPLSVVCHGSGAIEKERQSRYHCPFAAESATFFFEDTDVILESTRWLYDTIRQCREAFDVYGSKMSFEWQLTEDSGHVIFTNLEDAEVIDCPDTGHMLPPEIGKLANREAVEDKTHQSFIQGGGHSGSHPHTGNDFVQAIVNGTQPKADAIHSAKYTVAGICAQQSAMRDGERVYIPRFD